MASLEYARPSVRKRIEQMMGAKERRAIVRVSGFRMFFSSLGSDLLNWIRKLHRSR
jgi:hypothetical protein